jgi:hypothetical protein
MLANSMSSFSKGMEKKPNSIYLKGVFDDNISSCMQAFRSLLIETIKKGRKTQNALNNGRQNLAYEYFDERLQIKVVVNVEIRPREEKPRFAFIYRVDIEPLSSKSRALQR